MGSNDIGSKQTVLLCHTWECKGCDLPLYRLVTLEEGSQSNLVIVIWVSFSFFLHITHLGMQGVCSGGFKIFF